MVAKTVANNTGSACSKSIMTTMLMLMMMMMMRMRMRMKMRIIMIMHNPGKHAKFPPETLDFDEDHRKDTVTCQ
jgi:hypothetical protein